MTLGKNQKVLKIGSQRRDSFDDGDPPDVATIAFLAGLDSHGISKEDQPKLVKMRDYLQSMARASLSYENILLVVLLTMTGDRKKMTINPPL